MAKKKTKKWIKFRHRVITRFAKIILTPKIKLGYRVKIQKFLEQGDRNYLVLYNHQTAFDQFFLALSFRRQVYYVASEDIFSNGLISKLLSYAVKPIPIKKQTTDMRAVFDCKKVAKEGGTIAVAPEGNRTYSGKTEHIKDSIVKLARLLKLPIAFYKIENGYGVKPRWSDVIRKGKMTAGVSKVIEYDEYKDLTDDELYSVIKENLYVFEGKDTGEFYHKKSAEYLERLFYVCPKCGLSSFHSKNDEVKCNNCGLYAKYTKNKSLEWSENVDLKFVNDWYEYQNQFILDAKIDESKKLYTEFVKVFKVIPYKHKKLLVKKARVDLYSNKAEIYGGKNYTAQKLLIEFNKSSTVTVLGKNKLNVYLDDTIYQLKGDKRFNAVKYVHLYHKLKNQTENNDGKYLGL